MKEETLDDQRGSSRCASQFPARPFSRQPTAPSTSRPRPPQGKIAGRQALIGALGANEFALRSAPFRAGDKVKLAELFPIDSQALTGAGPQASPCSNIPISSNNPTSTSSAATTITVSEHHKDIAEMCTSMISHFQKKLREQSVGGFQGLSHEQRSKLAVEPLTSDEQFASLFATIPPSRDVANRPLGFLRASPTPTPGNITETDLEALFGAGAGDQLGSGQKGTSLPLVKGVVDGPLHPTDMNNKSGTGSSRAPVDSTTPGPLPDVVSTTPEMAEPAVPGAVGSAATAGQPNEPYAFAAPLATPPIPANRVYSQDPRTLTAQIDRDEKKQHNAQAVTDYINRIRQMEKALQVLRQLDELPTLQASVADKERILADLVKEEDKISGLLESLSDRLAIFEGQESPPESDEDVPSEFASPAESSITPSLGRTPLSSQLQVPEPTRKGSMKGEGKGTRNSRSSIRRLSNGSSRGSLSSVTVSPSIASIDGQPPKEKKTIALDTPLHDDELHSVSSVPEAAQTSRDKDREEERSSASNTSPAPAKGFSRHTPGSPTTNLTSTHTNGEDTTERSSSSRRNTTRSSSHGPSSRDSLASTDHRPEVGQRNGNPTSSASQEKADGNGEQPAESAAPTTTSSTKSSNQQRSPSATSMKHVPGAPMGPPLKSSRSSKAPPRVDFGDALPDFAANMQQLNLGRMQNVVLPEEEGVMAGGDSVFHKVNHVLDRLRDSVNKLEAKGAQLMKEKSKKSDDAPLATKRRGSKQSSQDSTSSSRRGSVIANQGPNHIPTREELINLAIEREIQNELSDELLELSKLREALEKQEEELDEFREDIRILAKGEEHERDEAATRLVYVTKKTKKQRGDDGSDTPSDEERDEVGSESDVASFSSSVNFGASLALDLTVGDIQQLKVTHTIGCQTGDMEQTADEEDQAAKVEDVFQHEVHLAASIKNVAVAVANMTEFQRSLTVDTTCNECLNPINQAAMLPCGHSFCTACVKKMHITDESIECGDCGRNTDFGYSPNVTIDAIVNVCNNMESNEAGGLSLTDWIGLFSRDIQVAQQGVTGSKETIRKEVNKALQEISHRAEASGWN